jgi:uncharacterized membrane protein YraQ (UPF0718 family)
MTRSLPNRPYLIAVPATSLVVALGATGLALGPGGIVAGAALGLVWSIALGLVVEHLIRRLTGGDDSSLGRSSWASWPVA